MVKLAAGICTYSDAKGLERTLSTIANNVDRCIIIHGLFPSFPLDKQSLKDTVDVCKSYNNITLTDVLMPMFEPIMRQRYFKKAQDYDFLMVIDTDEYVTEGADWSYFRHNLSNLLDNPRFYIYDIMFSGPPHHAWPRPRLFREPSRLRYGRLHIDWILPNGREIRAQGDSGQIIEGIEIAYDNECRTEQRNEARNVYRDWLAKYEAPLV